MYKRFCMHFLACVMFLLTSVAAVNLVMDPYGLWGFFPRVGLNMSATKSEQTEYLMKSLEVARLQPETIFLGNSQVMYAFDMEEYQRLAGKRAYNFAARGSTLYESRRCLEHAIETDPSLREVYLGLSYNRFIDGEHYYTPEARDWFLADEGQLGHAWVTPETFAKTVLSLQALKDSKDTLLDNFRHRWEHPRFVLGRPCDDNLLEFNLRERRQFNHTLKLLQREGIYQGARRNPGAVLELRRIVALCHEHGLQLTLFIPPLHARGLEEMSVCWDDYEDWLRELTQIAPVLDFTAFNEYTMSAAAPGQVTEATNPYFWDVVHGKAAFGNLLLADLLRTEAPQLGTWLGPESLPGHLAQLRQGLAAWEAAHPESAEECAYYAAFQPVLPPSLAGRETVTGQSVVNVLGSKPGQQYRLELRQSDKLDVLGARLTPIRGEVSLFAVLECDDGSRLYAKAEPWLSLEASGFMGNLAYAGCGFRVTEHLWNLPEGVYGLRLLEVPPAGAVRESGILASVEITAAAAGAVKSFL